MWFVLRKEKNIEGVEILAASVDKSDAKKVLLAIIQKKCSHVSQWEQVIPCTWCDSKNYYKIYLTIAEGERVRYHDKIILPDGSEIHLRTRN